MPRDDQTTPDEPTVDRATLERGCGPMGDAPGGFQGRLADRSPGMFLAAAGLMAVVAGLFATEVVTGQDLEAYLGAIAPARFAMAFLALLGRHHALAARLERGAAVVLGLGIAGDVLLVVGHLGQLSDLYATQPAWVDAARGGADEVAPPDPVATGGGRPARRGGRKAFQRAGERWGV